MHDRGELKTDFAPIAETVTYHAPCQQQGHGIGKPAMDLMALIPELTVIESDATCCGVAGTYGLKREKYDIAMDVGAGLFRADRGEPLRPLGVRLRDVPLADPARDRRAFGAPRRDAASRLRPRPRVIGLVIVSHSAALAEGVAELAREMGGEEVRDRAGGRARRRRDRDRRRARDGRGRATSARDDGVLVLMDLGSALMSAEMAVEMLDAGRPGRALGGAAGRGRGRGRRARPRRRDARRGRRRGARRAGDEDRPARRGRRRPGRCRPATPATPGEGEERRLVVENPLGLHARPAARFVATASEHDARVTVRNLTRGTGPADARSLTAPRHARRPQRRRDRRHRRRPGRPRPPSPRSPPSPPTTSATRRTLDQPPKGARPLSDRNPRPTSERCQAPSQPTLDQPQKGARHRSGVAASGDRDRAGAAVGGGRGGGGGRAGGRAGGGAGAAGCGAGRGAGGAGAPPGPRWARAARRPRRRSSPRTRCCSTTPRWSTRRRRGSRRVRAPGAPGRPPRRRRRRRSARSTTPTCASGPSTWRTSPARCSPSWPARARRRRSQRPAS